MINEDISNRTVSIQFRASKKIADEILRAMKTLMAKSKKAGGLEEYIKQEGNEIKLKDMVKKGQLEEIEVKEPEEIQEPKKFTPVTLNYADITNRKLSAYILQKYLTFLLLKFFLYFQTMYFPKPTLCFLLF